MFPILHFKNKLPTKTEPGSFGFIRKHDIHTGVDLYTETKELIYTMEDGYVVRTGHFTGEQVGTPWWNNTDYILIRSKSGCILYGEIELVPQFIRPMVNEFVEAGTVIGYVKPVLKKDKGRPMNMLHIELYDHNYNGDGVVWNLNEPKPEQLRDITPLLKKEFNRQKPLFRRLLGYIGINI